MRELDTDTEELLVGSRTGDKLVVYVWYDGRLALPEALRVSSWSADWDDTRQVKGTLSVDVVDNTGLLSPWLLDDPLGVGGSQLQVIYEVGGGGGQVNLGWYRISKNAPEDEWRLYLVPDVGAQNFDTGLPPDTRLVSVPAGSVIPLDADDLTINVKNDRLLAPESPAGDEPTALGEIERLLADIVPVNVREGVTDVSVPLDVIYERERLDAVEDLVGRLGAAYRMNGNGEFEIYPLAGPSVWTIRGGDDGALIRVKREQTLDGLYNVFVSDGTQKSTNSKGEEVDMPVRGVAAIEYGPLRDGGPHGRMATFHSSPLITSEAMAYADAETSKNNYAQSQTIDLAVSCLPHPGIETGDRVTVAHPVVDGRRVPLVGVVRKVKLSGGEDSVDEMQLTVTCNASDVMRTMGGVQRG